MKFLITRADYNYHNWYTEIDIDSIEQLKTLYDSYHDTDNRVSGLIVTFDETIISKYEDEEKYGLKPGEKCNHILIYDDYIE